MFGSAHAVTADELRSAYSADAFAGADADWRRLTANRIDECGRYGKDRKLRVDVLVNAYDAIGSGLESGDDEAAMKAAKRLSRAINANGRFAECWDRIARRQSVSREFRSMVADM
jgi:hypothetical protein